METPEISVLMPAYNSEKYLVAAIESILAQTFISFELLILDDGSTDRTFEIAQYYDELDSRVSVLKQKNEGISRTRNRLLSKSRAKYIAWMDSDDISIADRLLSQYNYLENNIDTLAVGCETKLIDENGEIFYSWVSGIKHDDIDKQHITGKGGAIVFPSSMMRRNAIIKAGGFDEKLIGAEDLSLFLRLAELGKIGNVPEVGLLYRQHLKSISYDSKLRIQKDTKRVIDEACKRRGIKSSLLTKKYVSDIKAHQTFNKWAWWALKYGNVSLSRKYAFFAVIRKIYYLRYWKTLFCAIRGH